MGASDPGSRAALGHLNLRVRDPVACRAFYEQHFGFGLAFEAEGGYFLRDRSGFLLALVPAEQHVALPPGFHIGFTLPEPSDVEHAHARLRAELGDARVAGLEDFRPAEEYVTFRCWDPDGTEVEVYWDGV